jgi:S-DNA-T family DNA segregation ATPase FtsK/SpoIIIE
MQRKLDMQADRIEAVLASHKVGGRVAGGTVTARFVRFDLVTPMGTRINRVGALAEEIALALGARSTRIFRDGDKISIEVARETAAPRIELVPLCARLANIPPITGVLGVDEEQTPLLLRLSSPDVTHVLIVGTTGSGKTALARALLSSLAMHNRQGALQMVLIDPKGRGFGPLDGLPHLLRPLVADRKEVLSVLSDLVAEMERRDALARQLRRPVDSPRLVVAVDELADLVQAGGKEVERLLTRLAQRGREAGIHLVCCTQKPTSTAVGPLLKANFPVRLVGSVTSPEEAKIATGLAGSGAEKLTGAGDFLLVTKGQTVRFQAAWIGESTLGRVVGALREGGRRSRRWSPTEARQLTAM